MRTGIPRDDGLEMSSVGLAAVLAMISCIGRYYVRENGGR